MDPIGVRSDRFAAINSDDMAGVTDDGRVGWDVGNDNAVGADLGTAPNFDWAE